MNVNADWRLRSGIASLTNFAVLLAALLTFPLVLRWTGALFVADIEPQSPQHTRAFLKFCFVHTAFLWICFAIALVGIRRSGRITWQEVVGAQWKSWQAVIRDLGIALGALLTMAVIGNLANSVLGPYQHDSAAFHSMVAQNTIEALAFLVAALTAGFVEEFVFRGYHSATMPGSVRMHDSRLRPASNRLYARTFLPGLHPIGAGSAHRGRIDRRGALAKVPYPWNDRARSWRWSRRLSVFCQAFVITS
jgi:membrane protease YdiL (CAAX protease family)